MPGSKTRKNDFLQVFTKSVRNKQEFSHVPEEYILSILHKEASTKELTSLEEHARAEKSSLFKEIQKRVRKKLHDTHGVFKKDTNKRKKLLKELKNNPESLEIHQKILQTHRSTLERINDYEYIYEIIKEKIGKFNSILDISSGINPVSWKYLQIKPLNYIACELAEDDVNFLNEYFSIMKKEGLNGRAYQENLLEAKTFPKTDICFLFKILDNLETLKRNSSKELLEKIPAKTLIVSFPKISISGKYVSTKRLAWFNKIAKKYETFETRNEIFYIIQK